MSIAAITSAVSQNQSLTGLFSVNRINPISGKDADGDDLALTSGIKASGNSQKDKLGKLNQAVLQTIAQMLGNTHSASKAPSVIQPKNANSPNKDQGDQSGQGVENFVKTLFDALHAKESIRSEEHTSELQSH